jgi:hypothetical protein
MMIKADAFESLAENVIFGTASLSTLESLRLKLKEGKTLGDVFAAGYLKDGQQPGSFEIMLAHVEGNLEEVVELDPSFPERTNDVHQNFAEYGSTV